jgi:HSP20 family protein
MEDSMAGNERQKAEARSGELLPRGVDPFAPSGLFGDFDRMVDGMMRGLFLSPFERRLFDLPAARAAQGAVGGNAVAPKAEFSETDKSYELSCELPGLSEKDIELTIQDGVIDIKGQKETRREEKDDKKNYHFSERSYGAFQRSFRLPENVDEGAVSALFENGVLTVTLPKRAGTAAAQKKIPIAKR